MPRAVVYARLGEIKVHSAQEYSDIVLYSGVFCKSGNETNPVASKQRQLHVSVNERQTGEAYSGCERLHTSRTDRWYHRNSTSTHKKFPCQECSTC